MTMSARWLAVALACSVAAAVPAPALAQPAEHGDRADELYKQGVAAFGEGREAEALRLFQEAWALKKGVDIAANLGAVALKLGKPREAAVALSYAIDHFPAAASRDARQTLMERLAEAKRSIGVLTITASVAGATISVDGAAVGKAPLTGPLFLDPGPHEVTAKMEGYDDARVSVRLTAGDSTAVELPLVAAGTGNRAPAAEPLPVWPAFVLGGLGAVGLGMGVGFLVMSEGAKAEIEDSACRDATCGAAFQDQVDTYDLGRNVAVPSFIVGGVGAVGAVIYGVLVAAGGGSSSEPGPAPRVAFAPILGAGLVGLTVGGAW